MRLASRRRKRQMVPHVHSKRAGVDCSISDHPSEYHDRPRAMNGKYKTKECCLPCTPLPKSVRFEINNKVPNRNINPTFIQSFSVMPRSWATITRDPSINHAQ